MLSCHKWCKNCMHVPSCAVDWGHKYCGTQECTKSVCVCIGRFSGTHTLFISGKWGIQKQWGYPQIQKSLVKQSRGSMHAIGCPLALLESSIFSPVTGRKSYLLCNFFLHIFGLLIAMFLGTSYEYTPWKWGIIHVPSFAAKYPIPRKPPHTCMCVCVCVCVCACKCVCVCVSVCLFVCLSVYSPVISDKDSAQKSFWWIINGKQESVKYFFGVCHYW